MLTKKLYSQQNNNEYRHRAKVLAVTSGKGGVGKTNISANLAICMAAAQKKVVLIDADLSLGNLDIILNINSKYNISHAFSGRKTLEEIIHAGPEGLEVICGASGLEELANINDFQRQRILNGLSTLQQEADVIVIDTAAGISKSVIGFCLASDSVLVVTTPEPSAMTDAYAMIKVLDRNNFAGRINLVVNMAETMAEGKKIYPQMAKVVRQFLKTPIYNAGVFLKTDKLTSAVKLRKPVVLAYPNSQIASSLRALANKMGGHAAINNNNEGFFKKVVDWLL